VASVNFNITLIETQPPEALAKQWPTVAGAANRAAGDLYATTLLPQRFKPGNREKFGFQPRKPDYEQRKLRYAAYGIAQEGGVADLVFRGTLRDRILSSGVVFADQHQAIVSMVGTSYVNIGRAGSPDKAHEIALLVESELRPVQETQERVVQQQIAQIEDTKTTRSR